MKADYASLGPLMARAQTGDSAAYRAVLVACQDWLKGFFAHRISASAIDDLVQDTLASVHTKRASYDPTRPFLPWLAAIARYRWIDQLRKDYRMAERTGVEEEGVDPGNEEAVNARISLQRLLEYLPDAQQSAIRLVKIDGLSIAEAANKTGQSPSLVKVNIHRGLKKLANLVEEE